MTWYLRQQMPVAFTLAGSSGGGSGGGGSTGEFVLPLGAGGYITGVNAANDGSMVVRTDVFGDYVWNASATAPNGATGSWQLVTMTSSGMPASFVSNSWYYTGGSYDIVFDPRNSQTMYCMREVYKYNQYPPLMSIYKSTDQGTHWSVVSPTGWSQVTSNTNSVGYYQDNFRYYGQKIAVDPTNSSIIVFGTPANGLWYTLDGFSTAAQVSTSQVPVALQIGGSYAGITGIAISPLNDNNIFACSMGNGVYRTTAGASGTWSLAASGGPTQIQDGKIDPHSGFYYCVDQGFNVWRFDTAWTIILADASGSGWNPISVCIDPATAHHVIVLNNNGQLNETFNANAATPTWGGWTTAILSGTGDVVWLAGSGFSTNATCAVWPTSAKTIISGGQNSVVTTSWGGSNIPTTTTWQEQCRGIEELVANCVIAPNGAAIVGTWDHGSWYKPTSTNSSYPTLVGGPLNNANVVAVWDIDWAAGNLTFMAMAADGSYAGGPQASAYSNDGGQTWTTFSVPYSLFGGNIAVSSSTDWMVQTGGRQPNHTTNGGATPTWAGVNIEPSGIANDYAISSGTYNSTTGAVSLTLSGSPNVAINGKSVNVSNLTGTGSNLGNLAGNFTLTSVSGSTVTYTGPTGNGAITITGGLLTGWSGTGSGAFSNTAGRFLAADRVSAGQYTIYVRNQGFAKFSGGTATFYANTTLLIGGNPQLKSVPGNASNLLFSGGSGGNPGSEPGGGALYYSTDGGQTWTAVTTAYQPLTVGIGATKPGQSYPSIYFAGWVSNPSVASTSLTVALGQQSFTLSSGAHSYKAGGPITLDDGAGNRMTGTVVSQSGASITVNVDTVVTGSGTHSATWQTYAYGIWVCPTGLSPTMPWQCVSTYPLGSMDQVTDLAGDLTTYGNLFLTFSGSGAKRIIHA